MKKSSTKVITVKPQKPKPAKHRRQDRKLLVDISRKPWEYKRHTYHKTETVSYEPLESIILQGY